MDKTDYITKEYLDKALDAKFESMIIEFKQYTIDLATGFREEIKGVCNQVAAIDEKLTRVDIRVVTMDKKLDSIGRDVFNIKEDLKLKADKKEVFGLKRRIMRLEAKNA